MTIPYAADVLHVRVACPASHTGGVVRALDHPGVSNVALLRGASVRPEGDVVMADVVRESVNDVIAALRALDVHRVGSIAVEHIDVAVSDVAQEAERTVPGYGSDAAVWEEVDARAREESTLTGGFVVFLVVAALLAAVGLLEDSPVLIVGAMVVGPEFGPIAGLAVGLFKRRGSRIRVAATTLTIGLVLGIVAAYLGTLAADALDLVPVRPRELTAFVVTPSAFSAVVAFLAGIVGMLSLTQAKAGALIGVLISVTTIPAAAAIGVSAALGRGDDARGATVQLLVNVGALVVASVVTLWVQRTLLERPRAGG